MIGLKNRLLSAFASLLMFAAPVQAQSGTSYTAASAFAINNWPTNWTIAASDGTAPLGSQADAACNPTTGSCSLVGLSKYQIGLLNTLVSITQGSSGAISPSAFTVGTTSSTIVAAGAFSNFLKIKPPLTGGCGIWVNMSGATATMAPPSEYIAPGEPMTWIKATGFLPTTALTAIAATSCPVTVEGN